MDVKEFRQQLIDLKSPELRIVDVDSRKPLNIVDHYGTGAEALLIMSHMDAKVDVTGKDLLALVDKKLSSGEINENMELLVESNQVLGEVTVPLRKYAFSYEGLYIKLHLNYI